MATTLTRSSSFCRRWYESGVVQLWLFLWMMLLLPYAHWHHDPNRVHILFVQAEVVAAILLPHGDVAYDPTIIRTNESTPKQQDAANSIHLGSSETGMWLHNTVDPDIIFLSSPHGIALSNDFALYLSPSASGSATIGSDTNHNNSYIVQLPTIQLAPNLTQDLIDLLAIQQHQNVTGVIVPSDGSLDMPLHWAEVIPLLLIPRRKNKQTECNGTSVKLLRCSQRLDSTISSSDYKSFRRTQSFHNYCSCNERRKHIIWTHPLRRYNFAPDMIPELLRLGKSLKLFFDSIPNKRIAVVISGDLSHTHESTGPYGYSNASAPFDAAVGEWARNPCEHSESLLITAAQLQPNAKACAFTGLVLLHGIMCSNTSDQWESHVSVNRNATYFGMMAANFTRTMIKRRS